MIRKLPFGLYESYTRKDTAGRFYYACTTRDQLRGAYAIIDDEGYNRGLLSTMLGG